LKVESKRRQVIDQQVGFFLDLIAVKIFAYNTRSHYHDSQVNNRFSRCLSCRFVWWLLVFFYAYDKYSSQRITFDKVQRLVSFLSPFNFYFIGKKEETIDPLLVFFSLSLFLLF